MPPRDLGDRVQKWIGRVHGISSYLTVSSSLQMPDEDLAKREKEVLAAEELLVERSERGLRIWGIVPAADTTFRVHVPCHVPSRASVSGLGLSLELLLSSIVVDCRADGGSDGFGLSTFDGVSAYDGKVEIASFPTPGWRGGERTFRLETLMPINSGLDVVYHLGTPLGVAASFEIHSTTVTLARPRVLSSPARVVGLLRSAIRR